MRKSTEYLIALINLYGIVHKDKVIEIYNMQNKPKIKELKYTEKDLQDNFIQIHGDYFVKEDIIENEELDYQFEMKKGKPYYIPEKEELLKYKDELYFEQNKEFLELREYFKQNICDGNDQCAEMLADDIQNICQYDFSTSAAFNYLARRKINLKTQDQVREILQLIANLANNTRIWENNGHTPTEMFNFYNKNNS